MKKTTFYLLGTNEQITELSAIEVLLCYLAKISWRAGKRVLISCEDKQQAVRLDEALWRCQIDAFIPHNLVGEGPKYGTPVELTWPQHNSNTQHDLLINLLPQFADFTGIFHEVIDFIPYEESLRQQARERYKAYRKIGFHLNIAVPPQL